MLTQKQQVDKAIKLLKSNLRTRYTCHALKYAGADEETMKAYQNFLVDNYPMIFIFNYGGLGYAEEENYEDVFDPGERELEMRVTFLKQFAEYL